MSEAIPLTITLASLPPDWTGNVHTYDATIPGRIVISAQQAIALFRSGTTEPTSDEGLWFDTGNNQWKYYDYDTGNYKPTDVAQANLRYSVSAVAPDPLEFLFWVVLDGNGQGEDIRTYYNGAWRSIITGNANSLAVFGPAGEGLVSVDAGAAGTVLTSNGPGALPSYQDTDNTPVGTVIMRSATATPDGYLPCEGQAVLRASYASLDALYSAEGYLWGSGDGVTTFNVPDFRGRFPLGVGTGTAADATAHPLGATGGEETHSLEFSELPLSTVDVDGAETSTVAADNTGPEVPHNNMPPYSAVKFFVKY